MDIAQRYSELTGFAINSANQARIYAAIDRTQSILEDLLGYTLDADERSENQLDGVVPTFAYRIFPVRINDRYNHIDPCTEIHTIKVLKNGTVEDTLTSDQWSSKKDRGYIKYFTINQAQVLNVDWYPFSRLAVCNDDEYEFAVDAEFVFADNAFPNDLMGVWADMISFYSKMKKDIKSETLGSHSYTRFDEKEPEQEDQNVRIIRRYAGPRGHIMRNNTF